MVLSAIFELLLGNTYAYTVLAAFGLFYAGFGFIITPFFVRTQIEGCATSTLWSPGIKHRTEPDVRSYSDETTFLHGPSLVAARPNADTLLYLCRVLLQVSKAVRTVQRTTTLLASSF